jgi:hypothetical protein
LAPQLTHILLLKPKTLQVAHLNQPGSELFRKLLTLHRFAQHLTCMHRAW